MKIIYRASDIVEAHIVSGMLKADGIDAYVAGHYLQGAVGDLSTMDYANVFVNDEDIDAALSIIKEYEQNSSEPVQDDVVAGSYKPT